MNPVVGISSVATGGCAIMWCGVLAGRSIGARSITSVPAAGSRKMRAVAAGGTGAAPSLDTASSTRLSSRRWIMARGTSSNGPGLAGAVSRCGRADRLLHRDRNMHAERDVRHAVAPVHACGGARKGNVVLLVGLREERSREVTHRIRHALLQRIDAALGQDRKSTRLNSSHVEISYAVFCLKKK